MFASNAFAVCGIFVISFAASPTVARAQDNGRTRLPNTRTIHHLFEHSGSASFGRRRTDAGIAPIASPITVVSAGAMGG
jgi:hypothetical protein